MGFIPGLIQGYTGQLEKKKDMQYQQEKEERAARVEVLTKALSDPTLRPEARDAALKELNEIHGGKKQKDGGPGDILKRLIGEFHSQYQPVPQQFGAQAQGAAPASAAAPATGEEAQPPLTAAPPYSAAPAPASLGEVPVRPGAAAPAAPPGGGAPAAASATPSEPPQRPGVFQTPAEEGQAEFARQKPLLDYQAKQEELKQQHLDTREDRKLKEQQDREDARQAALALRQKNQEAFQERMARLREIAAADRQSKSESFQIRLTDQKQADAMDKQAAARRNTEYNGTLTSFRQQLAQAQALLRSRESEAQKTSWYEFWKDSPDVKGAREDITNLQSTVNFLERNRGAVVSGTADIDDIVDQAEDILTNGVPATPDGAGHSTLPPGGQVTAPAWDLSKP